MSAIKVINPGGYTTVQDRGRFGYQNMGVPVSGVLDTFAFTIANILVGNPANRPVMEITVTGPSLEVRKEMDIALTGAQMPITINKVPAEQWRSIRVKPGDIINIGMIQSGCRSYLAFSGGIKVEKVMESFSTYVGAGMGGFQGRPIKKEDLIETCDASLLKKTCKVADKFIPDYPDQVTARVITGPQDDYFDKGMKTFFSCEYTVTEKADRMGYRLQGDSIDIKKGMPQSIVSEPSMPGSIQVPADRQPIILLNEQTVGGYAKIATIISSDLPVVAQTIPGNIIRFEKINLDAAHKIIVQQQNKINAVKESFY